MVTLQHQRGLGLIEWLISIAISTVLVGGLVQLYLDTKLHFVAERQINELTETARYTVDFLSREIGRAGYRGDLLATPEIRGTAAPRRATLTCSDALWARPLDEPLVGWDQNQSFYPCLKVKSTLSQIRGDAITIRSVATQATTKHAAGKLYLRTDYWQARMFAGADQNHTANRLITLLPDREVLLSTLYLAPAPAPPCRGPALTGIAQVSLDSRGALRRQLLVAGIEELQFQYGMPTAPAAWPVRYYSAQAVSDWSRVVSVRFWLLMRAACEDLTYTNKQNYELGTLKLAVNDHYRRFLASGTVFLRNRAHLFARP